MTKPVKKINTKLEKRMKQLLRDYNKNNINCDFDEILKELYFKPQKILVNGKSKMVMPVELALRKQRDRATQGDMKAIKFIHDELQNLIGGKTFKPVFLLDDIMAEDNAKKKKTKKTISQD